MNKYETVIAAKTWENYFVTVPAFAKRVFVTSSGRVKYQLLSNENCVIGTGMVNSYNTTYLPLDGKSDKVSIVNRDMQACDIYILFEVPDFLGGP